MTSTGGGGGAQPTLSELVLRAQAGDASAFESLHLRVGTGVRRLLMDRTAGQRDVVDDLSQKVWSSVWQALKNGSYDPGRSAITTYAYAVANNAWLSHVRATSSAGSALAKLAREPSRVEQESTSAGESSNDAEMIEAVRTCLREPLAAGLTDLERGIVRAIGAGEGDRDLARRLSLSPSTINKHKHSGYRKIREYLERQGLTGSFAEQSRFAAGRPEKIRRDETGGSAKVAQLYQTVRFAPASENVGARA